MLMGDLTEIAFGELAKENAFNNIVDEIVKAINGIETINENEKLYKEKILYVLIKLCETEDIFNNNLLILDKESTNGLTANYQKKFKR